MKREKTKEVTIGTHNGGYSYVVTMGDLKSHPLDLPSAMAVAFAALTSATALKKMKDKLRTEQQYEWDNAHYYDWNPSHPKSPEITR